MATELTEAIVTTIGDAARQLRGQAKRAFQARVAIDYLHGSARRAETVFGWGREAVFKGLEELEGLPVPGKADQTPGDTGRGRPKTQQRLCDLEADVRALVEPQSQADPKFQSAFAYTRMTAANVRRALIDEKGYRPDDLPADRTLRRMLNRFGFRLRRVQKTKPVKKIKETDAIFANVARANRKADEDPACLRISIDSKAKVKIGAFSRGGRSRAEKKWKLSITT